MIYTTIVNALKPIAEVYPLTAPEGKPRPYIVYENPNTDEYKELSAWTGLYTDTFELYIVADSYNEMRRLTDEVRDAIKVLEDTNQEVMLDSIGNEMYEKEIDAYQKNITIRISHKED